MVTQTGQATATSGHSGDDSDALYGAAGIATFPAGAAPANGVSLAEAVRDIWDALRNGTGGSEPGTNKSLLDELRGASGIRYNAANYVAVTADMTSATWNTAAKHEVFTVTGLVRMRVLIECTDTLTDAADGASIQFGDESSTTRLIGSTGAAGAGGDTLSAGEIWMDTSPADVTPLTSVAILDFIVANGLDIGYEITDAALTGGALVFHCWYEPLNATGAVAAGTGAVL